MMHDPSYIKELFSRFMAGHCSREEIDTLTAYLENAGDDQLFPSVEEFREMFPDLKKMDRDASERVLGKLTAVMEEDAVIRELPGKNRHVQKDGWRLVPWMGAAAAAILLLVVSMVLYLSYDAFIPETYNTGNAQVRTLELDDGTLVTLNANSALKVTLSADTREVWLDGEAFFRVAHDEAKKFVVHTSDQLSVEVLGTEFNVKDRAEGISVVLNKGSVKVKLRQGEAVPEELLMKPGEMVEYTPAREKLIRSHVDTVKYSSWKDNLLIFDETSLEEVARLIETQFGYHVTFGSDSLKDLRFTGSNPANDPDILLETLKKSFGLSIVQDGQTIRINAGR